MLVNEEGKAEGSGLLQITRQKQEPEQGFALSVD